MDGSKISKYSEQEIDPRAPSLKKLNSIHGPTPTSARQHRADFCAARTSIRFSALLTHSMQSARLGQGRAEENDPGVTIFSRVKQDGTLVLQKNPACVDREDLLIGNSFSQVQE